MTDGRSRTRELTRASGATSCDRSRTSTTFRASCCSLTLRKRRSLMRFLVTGSSGYIGSDLVLALSREGHQVIGLDRRPPPSGAPLEKFVQVELGAVRAELFGHLDGVFHLAAARADWGF